MTRNGAKMATDDVDYMRTILWDGAAFDGLREVFSSLHVRDDVHSHDEAIRALLNQGDDWADQMVGRLIGRLMVIDRYFADCLLPLDEHLADWLLHTDSIRHLLYDARLACEALDLVTDGPSPRMVGKLCRAAPEPRPRDGIGCFQEIAQRLLAYETILFMVLGIDNGVCVRLCDIVQMSLMNVSHLLEGDVPSLDVPDRYLAWCYSVGGDLAMRATYYVEPLVIVAEASKTTGCGDLVCQAIDVAMRFLHTIEAGEHEDILRDIELDLLALRLSFDHVDANAA